MRNSILRKQVWLYGVLLIFLLLFGYADWPVASPPSEKPDRVLVAKHEHKLKLLRGGDVLRSYRVSLGRGSGGPKTREGDHETPEGEYVLDYRNPQSRFYLALHVSYPNAQDIANARRIGARPGGSIMIHGLPNHLGWIGRLHRLIDWTDGCIAVTDPEMKQIWDAVSTGSPIEIRP